MNHGGRTPSRRQRKLPSIPPAGRQPEFWPSFRGAVDWLQKHQTTIDTALGLVELYPNLIRHKTCDKLWEFLSKVAFFDNLEANKRTRKKHGLHQHGHFHSMRTPSETTNLTSLTQKLQDIMAHSGANKRLVKKLHNLYICGNVDDIKWQHLVLDLCKRYHVRCHCPQDDRKGDSFEKMVFENDALLFLMDTRSVSNEVHMQRLKAAQTWEMHVLFVRDNDFVLPDTLPNLVQESVGLDAPHARPHTKEKLTNRAPSVHIQIPDIEITEAMNEPRPDIYHSSFLHSSSLTGDHASEGHRSASAGLLTVASCTESPLPFELPRMFLATPISRPDSGMSSCSSISNSSRGYTTPKPQKSHQAYLQTGHLENDSHPAYAFRSRSGLGYSDTSGASAYSRLEVQSLHKTPQSLVSFIKRGYRDAVPYFGDQHNNSLQTIVSALEGQDDYGKMKSEISEWISSLNTERKQTEIKTEDINRDQTQDRDPRVSITVTTETDRSLPSSGKSSPADKDTVFAVYTKDAPNPDIVHWPADNNVPVSNSPSVESFGFQDVDLSKNVNDVEWSSDEDS